MALENEGSNPSTHPIINAPIAQRTEHRSSEPRVVGSNPSRRVSGLPSLANILLKIGGSSYEVSYYPK